MPASLTSMPNRSVRHPTSSPAALQYEVLKSTRTSRRLPDSMSRMLMLRSFSSIMRSSTLAASASANSSTPMPALERIAARSSAQRSYSRMRMARKISSFDLKYR